MSVSSPGKKKILHVTEFLTGGIATYLNELLPWQGRHYGREQICLVCPESQLDTLSSKTRQSVRVETYRRDGRNPASLIRLAHCYRGRLKSWQPDVVHAHSSFAGAICRLPGLAPSVPLVYCAHGWAFDMDTARPARWLYAGVERWLATRCAAVITISEHDFHSARRNSLPSGKLHLVTIGLSSSRLLSGPKPARDGPLRLLYVGRFGRQKGVDWLLNLFAKLPRDRFELHLVGAVLSGDGVSLPDLANLFVHGWKSQEQLDDMFDAADAIVMPSRWEGFGLVAIEAMRRATAVLASDRGALPGVLGNDGGFLFPLENPGILEDYLLQIDRETLHQLGQQGRRRFIEYYTSERMIEQTEAVYRRVENV